VHLLLTGATGSIGRRLVLSRLERGDQLTLVSRDGDRAARLFAAESNPNIRVVEADVSVPGEWQKSVDGVDAVIHLAGAGLTDRRWTAAYRKQIVDSRLDSTHQVVVAIEEARRRPAALLCASATGFYGDAGDRELDETAPPGDDFLASLCGRWEAEAMQAANIGVRTVCLRIGIVLDERGGAVRQMLPFFRRFLGGPVGTGRQYWPWVHWMDVVGMIELALRDPRLRGPVNVVGPNAVTNREFADALGAACGRPSLLPAPRVAVRLLKGGIADFLTSSQRALPKAALRLGYRFTYPEISGAMRSLFDPTSRAIVAAPVSSRPRRLTGSPAARIRVLAIDVDGTLLRSDGQLADPVIAALHRAERRGVTVVLATARSPRLMREIVEVLRLESPTINCNGAVIWNPLDRRPQFHESMESSLAREVVAAARAADPGLVVDVDVLDRCHTDRIDQKLQAQVNRLVQPDSVGPLDAVLAAPVTRLNLIAQPERLARVIAVLQRDFWTQRRIAMFNTHPCMIQVTAPLVDKGIALQRVARRVKASREEVMAIGDAVNDLGMLEWAGFAVAMGNGSNQVKSLANAVAPSNDENGVAWAIERWVLSGDPAACAAR